MVILFFLFVFGVRTFSADDFRVIYAIVMMFLVEAPCKSILFLVVRETDRFKLALVFVDPSELRLFLDFFWAVLAFFVHGSDFHKSAASPELFCLSTAYFLLLVKNSGSVSSTCGSTCIDATLLLIKAGASGSVGIRESYPYLSDIPAICYCW